MTTHHHSEPHTHSSKPEPKLEAPTPSPETATSIPQPTQDQVNAVLQSISDDMILRGSAYSTSHLKVLGHQANVKNTLKNATF